MFIYTGEIQILRRAIDSELMKLREKAYDLSDPEYNYTTSKIATLYRIFHELQEVQLAEDPDSVEIKIRKSYH